jgi:hypothetical protein
MSIFTLESLEGECSVPDLCTKAFSTGGGGSAVVRDFCSGPDDRLRPRRIVAGAQESDDLDLSAGDQQVHDLVVCA